MIFSSHLFIFYFLPVVLLFNYTAPFRWLSLGLTILSYLFYGWANPAWVLLMLLSSYVDFFCGWALVRFSGQSTEGSDFPWLPKNEPRNRAQKAALAVSIVSNLAILGYFKYADFALASVAALREKLGLGSAEVALLHVALPAGVSFYTFVSMSYAIDVYRGDARALKNPIDYQFFVSLFPHLIAGPILRYQTVAEQIRSRTFTYEKMARGIALFSLALAKKVLLANPMAQIADHAFAAGNLHWYDAWYGVLAYAFQIYFDFSAYSEMAVGLGLMLGFYFMKNFDSPYLAESITDFWHRWHISLSTWLRDYLYLPLGGNRGGAARTYANLFIVMLLGGLWHGASWNFLIWGGIHGGMLSIERLQGKESPYHRLPHAVRVALTFMVVCLTWVFFRADTIPQSWQYIRSLVGLALIRPAAETIAPALYTRYHVATFALCVLFTWASPQAWHFTQRLTPARAACCLALLAVSIGALWTQTVNPFLYFQF